MIDYYALFSISLVPAVRFWKRIHKLIRWLTASFALLTIFWNVIGTYQYQHYIHDWQEMTWEKFKVIKWHTAEYYQGIWNLYKPDESMTSHSVFSAPLEINAEAKAGEVLYSEPLFLDTAFFRNNIAHVVVEGDFLCKEGSSKVTLVVDNKQGNNIYWGTQSVLSRSYNNEGDPFTRFYFDVPNAFNGDKVLISVDAKEPLEMRNLRIVLEAEMDH